MEAKAKTSLKTRDMAYCALMSVLIAVCSWISLPIGQVPFTLQTFGVFCALGLLGGARGTIAIAVYILLGAVGVPVFAGFSGGLSVLIGTTGGYIVGFLLSGLIYWLITAKFGSGLVPSIIGLVLGLAACYAFGTAWFMVAYARATGPIGLSSALMRCVVPFLLPDAGKMELALLMTGRLKKHVHLYFKAATRAVRAVLHRARIQPGVHAAHGEGAFRYARGRGRAAVLRRGRAVLGLSQP